MKIVRGTLRRVSFAAWDHPKIVAGVVIFVVFLFALRDGDENIRADLNRALLTACDSTAHLYRSYDAVDGFTETNVLQLSQSELKETASSWVFTNSGLSLQALGMNEGLLFDSTERRIRRSVAPIPANEPSATQRRLLFLGKLFALHVPLYTQAQNVSAHWKLQTSIDGAHYLMAQGRQSGRAALLSLIIAAFLFVPRYYRAELTRREFDSVLEQLPRIQALRCVPRDFILRLPDLATALHFDAAAVLLAQKGFLRVEQFAGTDFKPAESLVRSSLDCLETRAFHARRMIVANHPKGRRRIESDVSAVSEVVGEHVPCVCVPIIDSETKNAMGVLVAAKRGTLDDGQASELETLVRLVTIMFDQARASERLATMYQRTIRQTRETTLGMMVSVMSHNLWHRMSHVSTLAKELLNKSAGMTNATVADRLTLIRDEMSFSADFLSRLSAYRNVSGDSDQFCRPNAIDLVYVTMMSLPFFESVFELSGITLTKEFQQGFAPHVAIDGLEFNLVLTNLLVNALEAFERADGGGSGGRVVVSIRRVSPRHDEAVVSVTDNGSGIPAAVADRIFEDGFSTKGNDRGTGLHYCRNVIEQAGGRIELDRSVTSGARFNIYLPLK